MLADAAVWWEECPMDSLSEVPFDDFEARWETER